MMQTIVLSAGRSGTNLVLECLSGHSFMIPLQLPEDKQLFLRNIEYPDRYLCKSDIVYIPSCIYFHNFMQKNKSARIIWTIRHPYDWALSKLYRGRPMAKRNWGYADDATLEGLKLDLSIMMEYLRTAEYNYTTRILRVKMENVILDIENECRRMCNFLNIPFRESMTRPWERMRHPGKKDRYGDKLDKSQIDIYKQLPELYNGYFKDKSDMLDKVFKWIDKQDMIKELGYKDEKTNIDN